MAGPPGVPPGGRELTAGADFLPEYMHTQVSAVARGSRLRLGGAMATQLVGTAPWTPRLGFTLGGR